MRFDLWPKACPSLFQHLRDSLRPVGWLADPAPHTRSAAGNRRGAARAALLACGLYLLLPREAKAEGAVAYKFQSWQEEHGRIQVDAHYGSAEQLLPAEAKLKLVGVIDTIAGATPTGELPGTPGAALPTAQIDDRREAWSAELSKPFGRLTLSGGYANSRESDYVSDGLSLNGLVDFNQKNTTLLLGLAGTSDDVRVFYQSEWEKKKTRDVIVGVTQLLNPSTSVTVNLSYGRATGYLSDPYKLIQKTIELSPTSSLLRTFGENRPDERDKWTVFAGLNRAYKGVNGALDASYRWYHDSFGITSHTLNLEWYQKLFNDRLILRPGVRWYQQTGADFYYPTLDGTPVPPVLEPEATSAPYSADYRLAAMRTITVGLKAVYVVVPDRFSVDASFERYTMSSRDARVPAGAFVDANIITVGARFSW